MIRRTLLLVALIFSSSAALACGTPGSWMDVYEGKPSGNAWRDASSRLQALAMLLGCGNSGPELSADEQQRLLGILSDAMTRKQELLLERSANRDIREQRPYRDHAGYERLIEQLLLRYRCLPQAAADHVASFHYRPGLHLLPPPSNGLTEDGRLDLRQYFNGNGCLGHERVTLRVTASNGARLRSAPKGRVLRGLADGSEVLMLGQYKGWYRILHDGMVGYLHESVVIRK